MSLVNDTINEFYHIEMTKEDFNRLSAFITSNYGIKMPENKIVMLKSRLQKRLKQLNIKSFSAYIDYAFKKGNEHEIINMIDLVSTNKTDFFREPAHFTFLSEEILPNIVSKSKSTSFVICGNH